MVTQPRLLKIRRSRTSPLPHSQTSITATSRRRQHRYQILNPVTYASCHTCPFLTPLVRRPNPDVEYGHKQTVTGLLQEWVADIGSLAGLKPANTAISSGSVGVAESRLEVRGCAW